MTSAETLFLNKAFTGTLDLNISFGVGHKSVHSRDGAAGNQAEGRAKAILQEGSPGEGGC